VEIARDTVSSFQAVRLCDRNFGVGADGVIFALRPASGEADYAMRIFNSDGSEPEMCGNGLRCLARFVSQLDGHPPRGYRVATGAGLMQPQVTAEGLVCVDMGCPVLQPALVPTTLAASHASGAAVAQPLSVGGEQWRGTAVSMGNPHFVVFCTPSVRHAASHSPGCWLSSRLSTAGRASVAGCAAAEQRGPALREPRSLPEAHKHRVRGGAQPE